MKISSGSKAIDRSQQTSAHSIETVQGKQGEPDQKQGLTRSQKIMLGVIGLGALLGAAVFLYTKFYQERSIDILDQPQDKSLPEFYKGLFAGKEEWNKSQESLQVLDASIQEVKKAREECSSSTEEFGKYYRKVADEVKQLMAENNCQFLNSNNTAHSPSTAVASQDVACGRLQEAIDELSDLSINALKLQSKYNSWEESVKRKMGHTLGVLYEGLGFVHAEPDSPLDSNQLPSKKWGDFLEDSKRNSPVVGTFVSYDHEGMVRITLKDYGHGDIRQTGFDFKNFTLERNLTQSQIPSKGKSLYANAVREIDRLEQISKAYLYSKKELDHHLSSLRQSAISHERTLGNNESPIVQEFCHTIDPPTSCKTQEGSLVEKEKARTMLENVYSQLERLRSYQSTIGELRGDYSSTSFQAIKLEKILGNNKAPIVEESCNKSFMSYPINCETKEGSLDEKNKAMKELPGVYEKLRRLHLQLPEAIYRFQDSLQLPRKLPKYFRRLQAEKDVSLSTQAK